MSHLDAIYAPWDDNAAVMAEDIGEKPVTVRQWRNRGNIPSRYWATIVAKAAARGHTVPLSAFLPAVAMCGVCELGADRPEVRSCTAPDCPLGAREAA